MFDGQFWERMDNSVLKSFMGNFRFENRCYFNVSLWCANFYLNYFCIILYIFLLYVFYKLFSNVFTCR